MRPSSKFTLYCFLAALTLHILLMFAMGYNFHWRCKATSSNTLQAKAIHAYLYHGKQKFIAQQKQKSATPILIPTKANASAIEKKTVSKPSEPAKKQPASDSLNGQQMDALIALLHAAIQAQQVYPPSALDMGRAGRVTVSFMLNPDGSINDLSLMHSSGTDSLDQAGLEAVRNAAPFQGVAQLLKQSKDFQIDVVFELPQDG